MAASVHCSIVSAEQEIFSGLVEMVVATGTMGELGILPGHAPLLSGIKPGPIKLVLEGGVDEIFFASGGFIEVQGTAEAAPFSTEELSAMLALAKQGIADLVRVQKMALAQ